jgi:hypothetical protein
MLGGVGQATLTSGPAPAAQDLAGGQSAVFTFVYKPTAPGSATFHAVANGTDAQSGLAVRSEARAAPPMDFDTPAALDVTMSVPAQLSTGQQFLATLVVHNTGTATAKGVLPEPLVPMVTGITAMTSTTMPTAIDIPGNSTATFTWIYASAVAGNFTLKTGAKGADGNSLIPVLTAPVASQSGAITTPAALVVTDLKAPTVVNRGATFDVVMTVKNASSSTLTGVAPSTLTVGAPSGGAAVMTASTPASVSLAAGASTTFTWSFVEGGTAQGLLTFTGSAHGLNGTTAVNSNPTQSNLTVVVTPPELVIDSVTLPDKLSRGQAFDATVVVHNTGGSDATEVAPSVVLTPSGGAAATLSLNVTPQTLMGGARATFQIHYTESGAAPGALVATATAAGVDAASGRSVTSPQLSSGSATVQEPAALSIAVFGLPANVNRGQGFALTMTVSNSGEAAAVNVVPLPAPPVATPTGGVATTSVSTIASPVTILGGSSQTFIWLFNESGSAPGTLAFTGGAQGADGNSSATLTMAPKMTNVASVQAFTGCNGALLYSGFGGNSLDGDRVDATVGTDRMRVKPYSMLPSEYQRVLGLTSPPSFITGQATTFNAPVDRWNIEQQLSAVSLIQAFTAAFQGCLAYTATATRYGTMPTASTAQTECTNLQTAFWSRVPTSAELSACSSFAISTANNDTDPRRRWAYVCAAVMASTGFLAQ